MAVPITTDPTFALAGSRVALFDAAPFVPGNRRPAYDVDQNGERFLMVTIPVFNESDSSEVVTSQINVVLNWFEELKELVPTGQ